VGVKITPFPLPPTPSHEGRGSFVTMALGRPVAANEKRLILNIPVKEPKMSVQQDIANFLRGKSFKAILR
jgi:hypothetical protein